MRFKFNYNFLLIALLCGVFFSFGCSGSKDNIQILVAASLYSPFQEINEAFDNSFVIDYGGSNSLVSKVILGSKAELLVLAGGEPLNKLENWKKNNFFYKKELLTNSIVVVSDKKLNFESIDDICGGQYSIGIADPKIAPLGKYSIEILSKFPKCKKITSENKVKISSDAMSLRAALDYGHLDFALIYKSDIEIAKKNDYKVIFEGKNIPMGKIIYPLVVLTENESEILKDLINYIDSKEGRKIFIRHGFNYID